MTIYYAKVKMNEARHDSFLTTMSYFGAIFSEVTHMPTLVLEVQMYLILRHWTSHVKRNPVDTGIKID